MHPRSHIGLANHACFFLYQHVFCSYFTILQATSNSSNFLAPLDMLA